MSNETPTYSILSAHGHGMFPLPNHSDPRGALCVAQHAELPFLPQRTFWISNVPAGETRGQHAHAACAELLIAVHGSFDVWIDNGQEQTTYHLDTPASALYVGPGVWCELTNFSPDAVCLAFASMEYQPEGYINDYATFKESARH